MKDLAEYDGKLVAVRGIMEEVEPGFSTQELWAKDCKLVSDAPFSEPIALFEMGDDSDIYMPERYRELPEARWDIDDISKFTRLLEVRSFSEALRVSVTFVGVLTVAKNMASRQFEVKLDSGIRADGSDVSDLTKR